MTCRQRECQVEEERTPKPTFKQKQRQKQASDPVLMQPTMQTRTNDRLAGLFFVSIHPQLYLRCSMFLHTAGNVARLPGRKSQSD